MKKILFITISLMLFTVSYSQTAMTNPNGLALDTGSQAAAEGPILKVKAWVDIVSIQVPVTKISGTIAGTVKWQGSNDGVTYYTVSSDTLTDATNVYGFTQAPKAWLYYKALITQTGTSSLSYKAILYQQTKPN